MSISMRNQNNIIKFDITTFNKCSAILSMCGEINAFTVTYFFEKIKELVDNDINFQIWDMEHADFKIDNEYDFVGMILKINKKKL